MPNAFTLAGKRYMGSAVYAREDFDSVIEGVALGQPFFGYVFRGKITNTWFTRFSKSRIHDNVQDSTLGSGITRHLEARTKPDFGPEDLG